MPILFITHFAYIYYSDVSIYIIRMYLTAVCCKF